MYSIKGTGEIILPRGDTLLFKVRLKGGEFPEDTVGVFGICNARGTRTLFAKEFPVRENGVTVFLSNRDTRELSAGTYAWDLRIVTDPERDEDGNVKCDDATDNVISLFSGAGMPSFTVTEVAVDV